MRTLRAGLSVSYRRRAAQDAARHAARLLRGRRNVAVYLASGGELATAPLILELMARGHRLSAPRLHGDSIVFAKLDGRTHLRSNRFGILEPLATPRVTRIDAVLVPLLAYDETGARLGQGGGHYDRFLACSRPYRRPLRVGFAFALQQVRRVPVQAHDARMDAIVTEQGTLWPSG